MKDLLFDWNPWWTKTYSFKEIERAIIKEVYPWINRREIISIGGVRRAGKTTLLYEIISDLINKNKVEPKNILFIKADDDRVNADDLINISLEEYHKWINPESKIFLFVDEVQEIDEWERTLKRIYDLEKDIKIFISGSNASMLREDLSSQLAGRFAYFEVFPFSFSEFLQVNKIIIKNEFDAVKNKNKIKHLLIEYLTKGAFPEVVLEQRDKIKDELIGFYFDSIFYRDIIKKKGIRNPAKMEKLVKFYLQNISNLANFTKIAKLLDLTTDTVVEYSKALEEAYLIFHINLFEFSYKKQIINPKKIYCVDTGIRNIIGFNFSSDMGRLYENLVFVNLRRKNKEIYYWKNKHECDFIVKAGRKLEAVQVCYDIKGSKERELNGILEAMVKLNLSSGSIITEDYEAIEKQGKKTIRYIPLWKWLLADTFK